MPGQLSKPTALWLKFFARQDFFLALTGKSASLHSATLTLVEPARHSPGELHHSSEEEINNSVSSALQVGACWPKRLPTLLLALPARAQ